MDQKESEVMPKSELIEEWKSIETKSILIIVHFQSLCLIGQGGSCDGF